MQTLEKEIRLKKRHGRIRKNLFGTLQRPRLAVHRSHKNLYVQMIDDERGHTLASFSTEDPEFKEVSPRGGNVEAAKKLGEFFAPKIKEKGLTQIIFDRGGYPYHGRIRALAEALREGGLKF